MYFKAVTFVWMSLLVAMQTLQILREKKLSMNPPIACAPRLSSEKGAMLPRNTMTWPSKWNCTPRSYKTKTKNKMSDIQNMKMMSIIYILAHAAQPRLVEQLSNQQGIHIFWFPFITPKNNYIIILVQLSKLNRQLFDSNAQTWMNLLIRGDSDPREKAADLCWSHICLSEKFYKGLQAE